MSSFKKYFTNHVLLITILTIGAVLRFYGLGIQSLWLDELLTWSFSNQERLADVINILRDGSTHPPLYFSIIYFIIKYIGYSETILRLPSALYGVISILVVFFLAKRLYSRKEGIISALLMAVLWCPIYYSQEARPYSILLLFVMLSTYLWILILWQLNINQRPTYYVLSGYILTAIIASYSHYFGLYLVILQGIGALLFFMRRQMALLYIALIYFLIFILYLPWSPAVLGQINNTKNYSWIKSPEFISFLKGYIEFLFNNSNTIVLIVTMLYSYLLIHNLYSLFKNKSYKHIRQLLLFPGTILLFWLTMPFIIMFIKSILSSPILTYRNLIISLPAGYILLARSITQLPIISKNRTLIYTICITTGLLLYHLVFTLNYYSKPHKTQYRKAVYYVIDNDNNLNNSIVASSYGHLLKYYFIQKGYQKQILVGGGPFSYSAIAKTVNEKRPYYIWYINGHNFPTEEYAHFLYKNFDLSLITHRRFLGVDVWLFHTSYLNDIDKYLIKNLDISYLGFYDPKKWPPKYYTWRWSKKEGIISIPRKGTTIKLTFQCKHPDIKEKPVIVDLFLNKKPLDKITFTDNKRHLSTEYYIPTSIKGIPQLLLKVSRTWNPYKYGVSKDKRDLGVAVQEIKFIDEFTDKGIGFYDWEEIEGGQIPEYPDLSGKQDMERLFSRVF